MSDTTYEEVRFRIGDRVRFSLLGKRFFCRSPNQSLRQHLTNYHDKTGIVCDVDLRQEQLGNPCVSVRFDSEELLFHKSELVLAEP